MAGRVTYSLILVTILFPTHSIGSPEKVLVVSYDPIVTFHSHFMESLATFLEQAYEVSFLCSSISSIRQESLRFSTSINFVQYPFTAPDQPKTSSRSAINLIRRVRTLTELSTAAKFSNSQLVEYIKSANYSLIIYNSMDYGMAAFCLHLNISCIQVITSGLGSVQNPLNLELMGSVPYMLADFVELQNLRNRLANVLYYLCDHLLRLYYFYPGIEAIAREHNFITDKEIQSYWQVAANTPKATLIYSNNAVDCEIPVPESQMHIGGALLSDNALNDEYRKLMDKSANGVIVVAFGRGDHKISDDLFLMMVTVLSQLGHQVIWSVGTNESSALEVVPPNVLLVKSIPQNGLLAHPNCRLFLTHAGHGSTIEAIYNAVPVIAIPHNADQRTNANKLVGLLRMGIHLDYSTLSQQTLTEAVNKVLGNDSFAINAKTASTKFRSCGKENVDRKLFRIVHDVIKQPKGYVCDRTRHWFQVMPLDILALVILVLLLSVVTLVAVLKKSVTALRKKI